ncbi:kinase-like domain-containing protein [Glomus cerebriforme]|uniref:Kinase-like domain-containing protein n=1 Tax=Glomus cerebriforme TaxID=658196 RepID=A0A397T2J1_9GLOM|nr:kinase-like domain-containing protein [Glomus cerebriforme]
MCGNEEIDDLIQEMQLKIDSHYDTVLEWIPYNQINDIKQISKDWFVTIYSAIWKDGPLKYNNNNNKLYERDSHHYEKWCKPCCIDNFRKNIASGNDDLIQEMQLKIDDSGYKVFEWIPYNQFNDIIKIVALKCLYNSEDITDEFLNEIKSYSIRRDSFQNGYCEKCGEPYTHMDLKWCKPSGNGKIDNLIQEMQLKIDSPYGIVFEWIPYNQFNDIKEIVLKCLHNSEDITDEFLNEIKSYSITNDSIYDGVIRIYGMSQNPNTKDYILILQDGYCENCGEIYSDGYMKWCKQCQVDNFKRNIASGNEKIDNLIQEMQQKIDHIGDYVFEWIPYNQFDYVKEIGKDGFATVYSAIWKDGRLYYNYDDKEYKRIPNKKVALKCLHNSQNITDEFLNEIKSYSIKNAENILRVHGISQNPDTRDYIIVTEYAKDGDCYNWLNKNYNKVDWKVKIHLLLLVINGLNAIHQKRIVHRDFHIGNILIVETVSVKSVKYNGGVQPNTICISNMGLCGEADNIDETKIYGVMPYVAPEVLRGKPYTKAADIYSFGMIMYFVATGIQPFSNFAHDQYLALKIYNGIRPEINEPELPKCYIDLMRKCWNPNPDNRPNVIEVQKLINIFYSSCENNKEFSKAEEHKANISFIKNNHHPQAIYTSRLLNPFTKEFPKCNDNINNYSVEVIAQVINEIAD